MHHASPHEISKWANEIRDNLTEASKLRSTDPRSRKMKDDITQKIIKTIKQASKETNLEGNVEIEELKVPVLTGTAYIFHLGKSPICLFIEKNPLCPAFSEAAAISFDEDKGRMVKARRDIKVTDMPRAILF